MTGGEITRGQITPGFVSASRIALAEIAEILEGHPMAVIVGGMVPFLRLDQGAEAHEGTVDIDIVLDPLVSREDSELTLHEELTRRDFRQDSVRPFRWTKTIAVGEETHEVLVEFLAGGTPAANGLVRNESEDLYASVIPGMQVALHVTSTVEINGSGELRVASWPAYLAMKAAALARREPEKRPKDAYDIVYCLRCAAESIAEEVRDSLSGDPLVLAGILHLSELFSTPDSLGPRMYATRGEDREHTELLAKEAFVRVGDLIERVSDRLI